MSAFQFNCKQDLFSSLPTLALLDLLYVGSLHLSKSPNFCLWSDFLSETSCKGSRRSQAPVCTNVFKTISVAHRGELGERQSRFFTSILPDI